MTDGSKTNRATLSERGPIHLEATRLTPRLLLLQSPRSAIGHARLAIVRDRITQRVSDVVESRVDRADRPAGGRRTIRARAAGRCAALGRPRDVHGRADLRSGRDDLREAIGERAADQPLEPARDCRRSHATGPHPEHLAALGGAFFKKEADLKPHRVRYWLTPKPDPAFDAKCADICAVYQAAATPDDTRRIISIDEMTGIQALGAHRAGTADGAGQGRAA